MKHLVNVSGGAGSAIALFRAIDRYGRENVSASLADTNSEHKDLYRFADEVEREAGIEVTRLNNNGRHIWDVFLEELMFTNPQTGGCIAAHHLKKVPLERHANSIGTPDTVTIHVGFAIDEQDRIDRIVENGVPWQFDFPLTWQEPMLRCDVIRELRRRGIEECEVYKKGYPHSNCLRWNCIKAGIGQWIGVLRDNPAGYQEAEEYEQRFIFKRLEKGLKEHTILKDRRGGVTRNLSLRQLREECEAGVIRKTPEWREESTCSCFSQLF